MYKIALRDLDGNYVLEKEVNDLDVLAFKEEFFEIVKSVKYSGNSEYYAYGRNNWTVHIRFTKIK